GNQMYNYTFLNELALTDYPPPVIITVVYIYNITIQYQPRRAKITFCDGSIECANTKVRFYFSREIKPPDPVGSEQQNVSVRKKGEVFRVKPV
ncbi:hypothetical protein SY88_19930, partial [Clostridiales bacterium PH28_bin88]